MTETRQALLQAARELVDQGVIAHDEHGYYCAPCGVAGVDVTREGSDIIHQPDCAFVAVRAALSAEEQEPRALTPGIRGLRPYHLSDLMGLERDLAEVLNKHGVDARLNESDISVAQRLVEYLDPHAEAAAEEQVAPQDARGRQFRCVGCGALLEEAALISTNGGPKDAHLIEGSVPDYCGPVAEVTTPGRAEQVEAPQDARLDEMRAILDGGRASHFEPAAEQVRREVRAALFPWLGLCFNDQSATLSNPCGRCSACALTAIYDSLALAAARTPAPETRPEYFHGATLGCAQCDLGFGHSDDGDRAWARICSPRRRWRHSLRPRTHRLRRAATRGRTSAVHAEAVVA